MPRSYVDLPDGWELIETRSVGPFVTSETARKPDGELVTSTTRSRRKRRRGEGPAWWDPHRLGRWIAVLLAIGSTCFLVAAVVCQVSSSPGEWVLPTFFVGSIFFTCAAYGKFAAGACTPCKTPAAAVGSARRFTDAPDNPRDLEIESWA